VYQDFIILTQFVNLVGGSAFLSCSC